MSGAAAPETSRGQGRKEASMEVRMEAHTEARDKVSADKNFTGLQHRAEVNVCAWRVFN